MKKLTEIDEETFNVLRDQGFLKTLYPNAPDHHYSDIIRTPQPLPESEIDITSIIKFVKDVVKELEDGRDDEDIPQWAYETIMKAVYGNDIFKWINKQL